LICTVAHKQPNWLFGISYLTWLSKIMHDTVLKAILEKISLLDQKIERLAGTRLSVAQAAERTGKHRNTLVEWERTGRFPKRTGDGTYLLADVLAWESNVSVSA
jgi:hypothetical protein